MLTRARIEALHQQSERLRVLVDRFSGSMEHSIFSFLIPRSYRTGFRDLKDMIHAHADALRAAVKQTRSME